MTIRSTIIIILIVLVLVGIIFALNKPKNNLDNTQERNAQGDTKIENESTYNTPHSNTNNPLEWPKLQGDEKAITYTGFSLVYDELHEQARWVAYELTSLETNKVVERSNRFKEDPFITTGCASNEDYTHSGFDRGHLAPASDMGWSEASMTDCFYLSNMSPQNPSFNRGIWKKLETQVRDWAQEHGAIYVVTGPVLEQGLPTIGPNKVSVPKYFYKVLLDTREPGVHGLGFILPNAGSQLPLESFALSIDSVEKVTGINFFHGLSDQTEDQLEREHCFDCW
jgi:endonuclease G